LARQGFGGAPLHYPDSYGHQCARAARVCHTGRINEPMGTTPSNQLCYLLSDQLSRPLCNPDNSRKFIIQWICNSSQDIGM